MDKVFCICLIFRCRGSKGCADQDTVNFGKVGIRRPGIINGSDGNDLDIKIGKSARNPFYRTPMRCIGIDGIINDNDQKLLLLSCIPHFILPGRIFPGTTPFFHIQYDSSVPILIT